MESIPSYIESSIILAQLKGKIRDEITQEFPKSQGTVSKIIAKFRNEISHYDLDTMRTLGKELRQLEMTPNNCAMGFRIVKILQKLKIQKQKRQKNFSRLYLNFHNRWDINSEILRCLIRICQYFAGNAFFRASKLFSDNKRGNKRIR